MLYTKISIHFIEETENMNIYLKMQNSKKNLLIKK